MPIGAKALYGSWKGYRCHWRVLGDPKAPGDGSAAWVRCQQQPLASQRSASLPRAGYRVYGLDLIGFGRSEQPGLHPHIRLDNRLWARQLAAFLEQVVQQPAVLVGNSLGGLTALTTAVFRPEWVTTAVVAAPLPDPALMQAVATAADSRDDFANYGKYARWGCSADCCL